MTHTWKLTPDAEYRMREIALAEAVKHYQKVVWANTQAVIETAKAFEVYLTDRKE